METWLPVFLGPVIAIAVIVGLVKGVQALVSNETFVRILLSRPVAVLASLILVLAVVGFILLLGLGFNPSSRFLLFLLCS